LNPSAGILGETVIILKANRHFSFLLSCPLSQPAPNKRYIISSILRHAEKRKLDLLRISPLKDIKSDGPCRVFLIEIVLGAAIKKEGNRHFAFLQIIPRDEHSLLCCFWFIVFIFASNGPSIRRMSFMNIDDKKLDRGLEIFEQLHEL